MPALMGMVRRVAGLSVLRSSAVFALSGAAFALGTLLLARVMPVEQFGELSLLLALFNIFCLLAPAGIDQVAVRHRLAPGGKLLGIPIAAGGLLGLAIGVVTILIGDVGIWEATALGLSIWVGGLVVSASGFLRAGGRLGLATWIFTGGNWGLLLIGLLGQIVEMPTAVVPFGLFLLGQTVIAIIAWSILFRQKGDGAKVGIAWHEAAALVGMAAVGTLALQLERVLIPSLIGLSELALFSVLASVAIFPFRIVTAGLEFSLTPRLQAETDPVRRRALFRRELALILAALVMATIVILLMAPWVANLITGGRYPLTMPLLLAACANGAVKFLQTLPRSILTACGTAGDLSFFNMTGWVGLVLGSIGGAVGTAGGVAGVVMGVAAGTLVGSVPGFMRARLALRVPVR